MEVMRQLQNFELFLVDLAAINWFDQEYADHCVKVSYAGMLQNIFEVRKIPGEIGYDNIWLGLSDTIHVREVIVDDRITIIQTILHIHVGSYDDAANKTHWMNLQVEPHISDTRTRDVNTQRPT